jgi:hypothetical protein
MSTQEKQSIQGRLQLVLKDSTTGRVLQNRVVKNNIMAGGSELVAKLFCGELSHPISHVGLGTSSEQADDITLTNLVAPLASLAPIQPVEGEPSLVSMDAATGTATVKFAATFNEQQGNGALQEAGIFNSDTGGVLYNRVTFPVINKADNHTLTLEWEIIFSGAPQGI